MRKLKVMMAMLAMTLLVAGPASATTFVSSGDFATGFAQTPATSAFGQTGSFSFSGSDGVFFSDDVFFSGDFVTGAAQTPATSAFGQTGSFFFGF